MISFKLTLTPGAQLLSNSDVLTRLDLCQTSVLVSCLRFGLKMALSRSFIFIFFSTGNLQDCILVYKIWQRSKHVKGLKWGTESFLLLSFFFWAHLIWSKFCHFWNMGSGIAQSSKREQAFHFGGRKWKENDTAQYNCFVLGCTVDVNRSFWSTYDLLLICIWWFISPRLATWGHKSEYY